MYLMHNYDLSTSLSTELVHPSVHISPSSSPDLVHRYPNKCSIVVLSDLKHVKMVNILARQLNQIPTLVIFLDSQDSIQPKDWGYQHEVWVKYIPGRTDVSFTCPCDVHVHRGVFRILGHVNDLCSMKNKMIKVAYNMLPPFFAMNNGIINPTTLESAFLKTFLEKYNLTPSFIFAKQVWGIQDKTSRKWNGVMGLVMAVFLHLFTTYLFRLAMTLLI